MGEEFKTEGGVRQGCPLSPLLFIIVLELMAIEMREEEEMDGIKMVDEAREASGATEAGSRRDQAEGGEAGSRREQAEGGEQQAEAAEAAKLKTARAILAKCAKQMASMGIEGAEAVAEAARDPHSSSSSSSSNNSINNNNNSNNSNNSNNKNNKPTTIISSHSHRQKQNDTNDDRISMYADDSSTFVALTDMIKKAREIIGRYEKTTAGKLHDGKTLMMKLGITRQRDMTSKQLGVDFRVMEEGERESYLGDVIGHEVTEDERYEKILENIEETGQKWNRERIGIYGQAIVANTLLLSKISHRAQVNTLSAQVRKQLKEKFRSFMWKESKRGMVRWEILMMGEEEGGVGLRDPICALDAAKIRMLVALMTKDRQPWMEVDREEAT